MKNTSFTIYNASAGSGKTYTLAKEYIKILIKSPSNDAYKNILAITFTNKAVEEMKSRILFYLLEFSKEQTSSKATDLLKDIALETGLSLATIKDKSKLIIKNIIHNYTAFDISTIDKFTLKVIKSFVHELNIPLDFDVSLDTDLLMQEAIDTVISKAGDDVELTKLLLDFSKNKTDDDKNWDISYDLIKASVLITNENNKPEINKLSENTIEDFVELRKQVIHNIEDLKEQIKTKGSKCLQILLDNAIPEESFSNKTFPKHLSKIINSCLIPSEIYKYKEIDEVKINNKDPYKDKILELLPNIISSLDEIYKLYQKMVFLEAFKKNIYPLSLLNSINQEFKKIQEEQNIVSISEFNEIINNELQNQPAAYIYEKIGDRYKYFFIDEFQDTSVLQWENLFPLLDNALSSEENNTKGSLMIVGDPKQAIYRWRGGKAEQFIALSQQKSPFANPEKTTLNLETNYRSYSQIIEFNNDFFRFLAPKFENQDYLDLYQNKSFQNTNSKAGGFVNLSFVPNSIEENDLEEPIEKDDLYLNQTIKIIQNVLAKGFQYKDIAILTRTKDKGILVANFLTENEIPILSSETLMIQNATEVKLIINVLRYLNNKNDKDAKFNVLYFIGKYLQSTKTIHEIISQNLEKDENEFQKALEALNISIDFSFCRKKSLYEAAEIIVESFIKQNANNSYVQYFLDLVLERHTKAQSSIAEFLDYWERIGFKKSIPSPEGNNAVKILTIHKSKGLEFPIIIYPFANDNFSKPSKDQLWIPIEDENFKINKALVNKVKDVSVYSETANDILQIKNQEELLDAINVLYVAFTRAAEQLYVISEMHINKNGSLPNKLSSFFIEYLQLNQQFSTEIYSYDFGNPIKISSHEKMAIQLDEIKVVQQKMKHDAIKIAQRDAIMWGTHQQEAIEFGNTIHEILSFIKTKDDIAIALKKSLEKGLCKAEQIIEVENFIRKIIFNDKLNHFYANDIKCYNERSIIDSQNKILIPDKIVIKNNEAFILDYKTGAFHAKHKSQIESYQLALEKMGFVVKEKILAYISNEIEVVSWSD